ncbi:hypothetical protein EVAR_39930_1 [Eumeta japonica]|uniref:Uncharacterized protein n=1 Tax=Eumeta variegata TaxID=151549 RepID=A0A4C1WNN9_EUMVA|nr:hypothetical protein EVAR_39930_1 [Eumeta japonica]
MLRFCFRDLANACESGGSLAVQPSKWEAPSLIPITGELNNESQRWFNRFNNGDLRLVDHLRFGRPPAWDVEATKQEVENQPAFA